MDAQPTLFGAVDEEEAAEGPVRLAAERGLGLLVEQDHASPRIGQLGGRHEPGQPSSDNDDIRVRSHEPTLCGCAATHGPGGSPHATRRPCAGLTLRSTPTSSLDAARVLPAAG